MLFSTDPDPVKSKTKCMLFSKKDITAEKVKLDNNELPWVTSAKHLGSLLSSKVNQFPVIPPKISIRKRPYSSKRSMNSANAITIVILELSAT